MVSPAFAFRNFIERNGKPIYAALRFMRRIPMPPRVTRPRPVKLAGSGTAAALLLAFQL
jgi:hypothetical protein